MFTTSRKVGLPGFRRKSTYSGFSWFLENMYMKQLSLLMEILVFRERSKQKISHSVSYEAVHGGTLIQRSLFEKIHRKLKNGTFRELNVSEEPCPKKKLHSATTGN